MLEITKDGANAISLDEYADSGTHWIALYNSNIETIYFDRIEVEHSPKFKHLLGIKT